MPLGKISSIAPLVVCCIHCVAGTSTSHAQCHRGLLYERDSAFGAALALDGKHLIVGGGNFIEGFSNPGGATVFERINNTWFEQARLTVNDPVALHSVGESADISGDYFVAGAWGDHGGCPPENPHCWSGGAYVFKREGTDWFQQAKLNASDAETDDRFGGAVGISGDYVVVGAFRDDDFCPNDPACDSGSAYVYKRDGSNWIEEAKLLASDAHEGDYFGGAVAIQNDVIVVGAERTAIGPKDNPDGRGYGAVYAFRRSRDVWAEEAELRASDMAPFDYFGRSVAIDGDRIAVGACEKFGGSPGKAYVFKHEDGEWIEEFRISGPELGPTVNSLGFDVSIRSEVLVVSAGNKHFDADGEVFVFKLGSDGWTQAGRFVAGTETISANAFGFGVITDGVDVIVAGARTGTQQPDTGNSVLHVYPVPTDCNDNGVVDSCEVYEGLVADCNDNDIPDVCEPDCNGNGVPDDCDIISANGPSMADCNANGLPDGCDLLSEVSTDEDLDGVLDECIAPPPSGCYSQKFFGLSGTGDEFGATTTVDGDRMLIGAPDEGLNGAAAFYRFDGETWVEEAWVYASAEIENEIHLGGFAAKAVALRGDLAVVGAHDSYVQGFSATGAVVIYRHFDGTWVQEAVIPAPYPDDGDSFTWFGDALATDGEFVAVGLYRDDVAANNAGVVYVYRSEGAQWVLHQTLRPSDLIEYSHFGIKVAMSAERILVSAHNNEEKSGAVVYVYDRDGATWTLTTKLRGSDVELGHGSVLGLGIDGNVVVAGMWGDDEGCPDENPDCNLGSAYVFRHNGLEWIEEAKLTAPDAEPDDLFGINAAVSGDVIAVSLNQGSPEPRGEIYTFRYIGTDWVYEDQFVGSDVLPNDRFGREGSISLSGTRIVAGAYYHSNTGAVDYNPAGAVYVFERDEAGWSEQVKIMHVEPVAGAEYGASAAMNGDLAVIGAPRDDNLYGAALWGSAYVYRREGSGWIPDILLGLHGHTLGTSVSIFGDYLAVGAPSSKVVSVFKREGPGSWPPEYWRRIRGVDANPNPGAHSGRFGESVSIHGDYLLISDPSIDDIALDAGAAYLFRRNGDDWLIETPLIGSDVGINDSYGQSVSLGDGLALVGAPRDDEMGGDTGAVYIFRRDGVGWLEETKLTASDATPGDRFGSPVALEGEVAVIAAPLDDDSNSDSGSVYIFRRVGMDWFEEAKLQSPDAMPADRFGAAVAIDGDVVVVGSEYKGVGGTKSSTGAAYVFRRQGGEWVFRLKLTGDHTTWRPHFGTAVAVQGDVAFIGAKFADAPNVACTGTAFVFPLGLDSLDCDGNGTPDECDPDCNGNGIPDACDIPPIGAVPDCNLDAIPDDCQLAGNDCNANAIPDKCDPDENGDGVPDDCCITNATCVDSNPCTFDQCTANICRNIPAVTGDIAGTGPSCGPDGRVDISDIFAILDGFQNQFAVGCSIVNIDLSGAGNGCEPDGTIDISDIFAVIDAFQGTNACCVAPD